MQLKFIPLLVLFTLVPVHFACSESSQSFTTEQAVEYQILEINDTSFAGRKRFSARILAPTAHSFEQRAQTALKAAVDLQKSKHADAGGVFLEISPSLSGKGYNLAIAYYAPDSGGWTGDSPFKNGTWEAQATEKTISKTTIKMAELWYLHEDKFQIDDGYGGTMTDEEALKKYLGEMMNIDSDGVANVAFLPLLETITTKKPYNPK